MTKAKELDFDDKVENALNAEDSDEDIAAEYMESERVEQEYEERCSSELKLENQEKNLVQSIFVVGLVVRGGK